jgi:hypothetical protein
MVDAALLQAQNLVHDFTPQDISNLLWAYAKMGVRPPHMLLVALWESVGIGTATGSSSSSGSGGGAWGSSSSSSGSLGARLSAFKPQELAMLVWALAVLKLVPGGFACSSVGGARELDCFHYTAIRRMRADIQKADVSTNRQWGPWPY